MFPPTDNRLHIAAARDGVDRGSTNGSGDSTDEPTSGDGPVAVVNGGLDATLGNGPSTEVGRHAMVGIEAKAVGGGITPRPARENDKAFG